MCYITNNNKKLSMNGLKIIAFKLCFKERENMKQIFSEDKDEEDRDD